MHVLELLDGRVVVAVVDGYVVAVDEQVYWAGLGMDEYGT